MARLYSQILSIYNNENCLIEYKLGSNIFKILSNPQKIVKDYENFAYLSDEI